MNATVFIAVAAIFVLLLVLVLTLLLVLLPRARARQQERDQAGAPERLLQSQRPVVEAEFARARAEEGQQPDVRRNGAGEGRDDRDSLG